MERGLIAAFQQSGECALALRKLRDLGYTELDAYTPYPVEEVEAALGLRRSPLPRWVLLGALTGAGAAFLVLWWTQSVDYPLNVGGRPRIPLPAFGPIMFETAVLFGALAAFFGMLVRSRLPRFHHPLFEIEGFERASVDQYFVAIARSDPRYDEEGTRRELEALAPVAVRAFGLTSGEVEHA